MDHLNTAKNDFDFAVNFKILIKTSDYNPGEALCATKATPNNSNRHIN